jgi:NADPH-dependent glutamate synthase beta subunit-like oxidoreductase
MRNNLLEALSDNIVIDRDKCTFCGICVETCILDNLRLQLAPCRQACPLGVNVQGYIQQCLRGEDSQARETLREALIFPEILGRICPAPCEDKCHRGQVEGQPVAARAIKRYLFEGQKPEDIPLPEIAASTGKKAVVIGSGPAGLQAAHDLRRAGHEVDVLESEDRPGGMLRWAIPEFRLPTEVLERELTLLEKMGVQFNCGVKVGEKASLEKLQAKYDAVVMAAGCTQALRLGVPGEDLDGIYHGLEVLKAGKYGQDLDLGKSVAVIGGGNVAVDAAQVALRLGAEQATVISLEIEDALPAFPEEVSGARAAGVRFEPGWGPVRLLGQEGRVCAVELKRCLSVFDARGSFAPQFDACVLKNLNADTVIVAIGQERENTLFQGLTQVNRLTLQAGSSNLFLAGDCYTGPSSVVAAMSGGRQAAESANRFLAGEHLSLGRSYPGPVETEFDIDISRGSSDARVEPPRRKFQGKGDFQELEGVLSQEEARREAGRCYSCGAPFGKYRTCWFCLPCEVECPHDALWVEIPYLLR